MRLVNLMGAGDLGITPAVRDLADDPDPLVARKGRMLLELVGYLEEQGRAPELFGYLSGDELWLFPVSRRSRAHVRVAVDWPDRGPVRDGLPEMYYRLSLRRAGAGLSRDVRSGDVADVERAIGDAFGWARRGTGDADS